MATLIKIENIEQMRLQEGIDDVDLRLEIRGLHAGDFVKLTLVAGPASFETVLVRITSVHGSTFRGKLSKKPKSAGLAELEAGSALTFTPAQIHSVAKGRPSDGEGLLRLAKS